MTNSTLHQKLHIKQHEQINDFDIPIPVSWRTWVVTLTFHILANISAAYMNKVSLALIRTEGQLNNNHTFVCKYIYIYIATSACTKIFYIINFHILKILVIFSKVHCIMNIDIDLRTI